ncbi:hypothetical protein OSJ77_08970 [Phyllobacterium sp. 0TCS1.6C]|jgi:uncharacterized protein|uniref:YjhX family toxin n=1 Tax=unclassified Phyllobacterium TaxID=2638441 RepID=UPI0022648EE2|nr:MULTISPECIES: YjhX family toxin [unclassified Phyllobacterium]MCX8280323.1 hypothetical protein [Phyllobacterium sp. 0TCS1.6C]MCX8295228.1 hypothetical protein [Phyllobacterium sp. 0TCS1.6A]
MDISRDEQRILHLLAQGGKILLDKDDRKTIREVICLTRDGSRYMACDIGLFRKLKQKRAIASSGGGPYHVTRRGLQLVRSELDNR